jgi:hypothetical protein
LSVDDWIQAGFAILVEEGIKALKIDRLCRRLEVTKGERQFRRRHRLPAARWPAAQRTRRRRPDRLPGDHAQALTPFRLRLPYHNVWYGFMPCQP